MVNEFVFGDGDVAFSAGMAEGTPAIVLAHRVDVPAGATGADLFNLPDAVVIRMRTPEAVIAVIQMVLEAVATTARAAGFDPEAVQLPIVTTEEHYRRVNELLEANNALLERARVAERANRALERRLDAYRQAEEARV